MDRLKEKVSYDVAVDSVGMSWEQAGPLFERYTVDLAGQLDRRWVDIYKRLSEEFEEYARFRLDPGAGSVSFTTRSTDSPIAVMSILKKLEDFVDRVNREAAEDSAAGRLSAPTSSLASAKGRFSAFARLGSSRGEPVK